ncbi:hypothetical protein BDW74DRAFT_154383 [Aspergillus multicolor]|uniref:uncharacterized protein n=1 Tax=Aspergillus multicolor TaxID=41759 RepID=UPI003CCDD3B1
MIITTVKHAQKPLERKHTIRRSRAFKKLLTLPWFFMLWALLSESGPCFLILSSPHGDLHYQQTIAG